MFRFVGPRTGPGVAISRANGRPRKSSPEVGAGQVAAVVGDGAGGWFIGGHFATVAGVARRNIAHIQPDGRVDRRFDPRPDGDVTALAVSGRTVYVGGLFREIGGQRRVRLAALGASDGRATGWHPDVGAIDPRHNTIECADVGARSEADIGTTVVSALAVSGRTVYVGGSFNRIGGGVRHRIAALAVATGRATGWNPGANGAVCALALSGSTVYAGGNFDRMGGRRRGHLAALRASTGHLTGWNPDARGFVNALAVFGQTVYVGGFFDSIGGGTRNGLAALSVATGAARSWNPRPEGPSIVEALAVSGGSVYAGGTFDRIGGQARRGLAALDAASGAVTAWNPNPNGHDGDVGALAVSRSSVYAGGSFTSVGGQPRNGLAAIDAATGRVTGWKHQVGDDPQCAVDALAVSGSTIYAGGNCFLISGQRRGGLVALDANTGAVTDWNPHPDGRIIALAVSGQTVYAGGDFNSIGGQPRHNLAALDATTGAATDWNPNPKRGSFGGQVYALAVSGSTVYSGGDFVSIGGQPRKNLAALDATSGTATDWNPDPTGGETLPNVVAGDIDEIALSGPTIYVAGLFTTIGGQPRHQLAALDTTTAAATDWNPNPNGFVAALAASDSTVYAGGNFTSIGGQPRGGLAALDASTGAATDWNPNPAPFPLGAAPGTIALALSGATLYAGGDFRAVGPLAQQGFAEFTTP